MNNAKRLQLNTSILGQGLVQFTPATTKAAAAATSLTANTTSSLAKIDNQFITLQSWWDGLIGNLTSSVDESLDSSEATLTKGVLDELGLQDYYTMHLLKTCSGNLSDTFNPISAVAEPDSMFTVKECVPYSDVTGGDFPICLTKLN
jgi:hypothetical protein